MRDQFTVGIGHAPSHFGHLSISQPPITHMLDIVEQCPRGSILLGLGQTFDLA